jgi:tetratricopeptide (TPR) repeat protein
MLAPAFQIEKNFSRGRLDACLQKLPLSLISFATLYSEKGRFEEARRLAERALSAYEMTGKIDCWEALKGVTLSGDIYVCLRQHKKAEELARRELVICEKMLGSKHDSGSIALALTGLAVHYHIRRRYSEAEELRQRALASSGQAISVANDGSLLAPH